MALLGQNEIIMILYQQEPGHQKAWYAIGLLSWHILEYEQKGLTTIITNHPGTLCCINYISVITALFTRISWVM